MILVVSAGTRRVKANLRQVLCRLSGILSATETAFLVTGVSIGTKRGCLYLHSAQLNGFTALPALKTNRRNPAWPEGGAACSGVRGDAGGGG